MPRHPHEPVTPTLPFPPFPPAPPCGCTPPRMRPEPFSPGGLPAPHGFDFGRWAREKINWLLSLVPSAASPDNPLADREWVAGQAVGGKADKVAGATAGNLAGLDSEGNLADSGTKPDDFATAAQGAKADTAVQPAAIVGFVDDAEYDADYGSPPKPTILLKHGGEVVATVDATDFVIDGMVSNVEVKNGYLVITFNTDSGKQPISIPLTDIFNPDNYYTKSEVDGKLDGKQAKLYTQGQPDWTLSTESTGEEMAAFMADAANYSVSEEVVIVQGIQHWVYSLEGYNTEAYFVAGPFSIDGPLTTVNLIVSDPSRTDQYGSVTATRVDATEDIPAQVDTTPTHDSGRLVTGGGVWSAIWGALSALPTGFTSLYDWVVDQLAGKEPLFQASTASGATIKTVAAIVKDGSLLKPIDIPTSGMTVNGKALSSDVTLTGADIAVSGTDAKKIDAALAGKANDNAVVKLTGNQSIAGTKTFTSGVMVADVAGFGVVDPSTSAMAQYKQSGIEIYPPDSPSYVLQLPAAAGVIALTAGTGHNGNLAALDAQGNPTNSTIPAANVAAKGNIPYALVAKTIANGAVSLDDRAINAVSVSSSLASLTVNFPTATSGKVRDFGLRLTVASGITTAPQLVLPQGVTCENADGEAPEIGADGVATILYFTETASGVFLVKGETLTAITQA